jgi:hypothetical protein
MNRIRGHEIDEEPALIEFSLYACSSGRIPRGHGQAPHAGDLPFVANATPTTAAAQCKDPLPMIIHHPAIYFPLLLVAEPEEKDGLVPPLGSVPATTSKETCKSGAKTCSLPRLRAPH